MIWRPQGRTACRKPSCPSTQRLAADSHRICRGCTAMRAFMIARLRVTELAAGLWRRLRPRPRRRAHPRRRGGDFAVTQTPGKGLVAFGQGRKEEWRFALVSGVVFLRFLPCVGHLP